MLEAIGRGAAATKYNIYASLSNMPIAYMTIVDGKAYDHWHANGLLVADAAAGLAAVAFFAAVVVSTLPSCCASLKATHNAALANGHPLLWNPC